MQKQHFAIFTLSLVILLTATNLVEGQFYGKGKCPNVKVVKNFNLSKYLKPWVVYEKNSGSLVQGSHCLRAIYGPFISKNKFSMTSSRLDANNKQIDVKGSATVLGEGKLLININFGSYGNTFHDYVIDFDGENYAVVFTCDETKDGNTQYVSILTTTRNPSPKIVAKARAALKAQGLPTAGLKRENQSNCPFT